MFERTRYRITSDITDWSRDFLESCMALSSFCGRWTFHEWEWQMFGFSPKILLNTTKTMISLGPDYLGRSTKFVWRHHRQKKQWLLKFWVFLRSWRKGIDFCCPFVRPSLSPRSVYVDMTLTIICLGAVFMSLAPICVTIYDLHWRVPVSYLSGQSMQFACLE